jgi:hypothetical protein
MDWSFVCVVAATGRSSFVRSRSSSDQVSRVFTERAVDLVKDAEQGMLTEYLFLFGFLES